MRRDNRIALYLNLKICKIAQRCEMMHSNDIESKQDKFNENTSRHITVKVTRTKIKGKFAISIRIHKKISSESSATELYIYN